MNKPCIELGDILTFGKDPKKWKCVEVENDPESPNGIGAFRIVPVDGGVLSQNSLKKN